jgi:hypothetical protein
MTGNRLAEKYFFFTISFFNGTPRIPVLKENEGTFPVMDEWGHEISLGIIVKDTMIPDMADTFRGHERLNRFHIIYQQGDLIGFKGRPGVALYAAGTVTLIDITGEPQVYNIIRYDGIIDNDHISVLLWAVQGVRRSTCFRAISSISE